MAAVGLTVSKSVRPHAHSAISHLCGMSLFTFFSPLFHQDRLDVIIWSWALVACGASSLPWKRVKPSVWCASEEGEEMCLHLSFHPIIWEKNCFRWSQKEKEWGWGVVDPASGPSKTTNVFPWIQHRHPDISFLLCFISNMWLKCDKHSLNRSDAQNSAFRACSRADSAHSWLSGSTA